MNPTSPQQRDVEVDVENSQLTEVLKFYDCGDLLPFCYRIIYLSNVKEALGNIPKSFQLSSQEITSLIILKSEQDKKVQKELQKNKKDANKTYPGGHGGKGLGKLKYNKSRPRSLSNLRRNL